MNKFLNVMRMQASLIDNRQHIRIGIVTSYNPVRHSVVCKIQPEDPDDPSQNLSGDLKIAGQFVGNGWGMFCAPGIGDQVIIGFEDGDINSGFVLGRLWSYVDAPLSVPSQEFWLVHSTGSYLKFLNNGKIEINGAAEIDMTAPTVSITTSGNCTINASGNASISANGNATISAANASVTATSTAAITAPSISLGDGTATLSGLVKETIIGIYNGHTHPVSGSSTAAPVQQMSSGDSTNVIKGS